MSRMNIRDHASIMNFIERNWRLSPLSNRSRDNLPNPKTSDGQSLCAD